MSPTQLHELLTDSALGVGCYFVSDEIAQRLGRSTHATESTSETEVGAPACGMTDARHGEGVRARWEAESAIRDVRRV